MENEEISIARTQFDKDLHDIYMKNFNIINAKLNYADKIPMLVEKVRKLEDDNLFLNAKIRTLSEKYKFYFSYLMITLISQAALYAKFFNLFK